jgi:capsular polysaccharide biosynthesis protein
VKSRDALRRFLRRFGLLLALTLVGGVAGGVYGAHETPTYTAKAYVVAIGDPGDSISALNFAQAYGRIATSGPVLAMAGTTLGRDRSGLADVTASTSPDAPVVELTATGHSAGHATAVANAMANALVTLGNARKVDTRVTLQVLAAATVPSRPTSPRPPLELAVGAAAGFLIGGLAALAGVGRVPAARAEAEARRQFAAAEVDEPVAGTTSIERYLDSWRLRNQPAITDGTATTVLNDNVQVIPLDSLPSAVPVSRIVGRAAVAGADDDQ